MSKDSIAITNNNSESINYPIKKSKRLNLNRDKLIVAIMIILSLAGIGFGIYEGIENAQLSEQIAELQGMYDNRSRASTYNNDNRYAYKTPKNNDNADETKANDITVEDESSNRDDTFQHCNQNFQELDSSLVITHEPSDGYNYSIIQDPCPPYINVKVEDSVAYLDFDDAFLNRYELSRYIGKTFEITFNQKITQAAVGLFGNGDIYYLVFLLENGSLKYLDIWEVINNDDSQTVKSINELKDTKNLIEAIKTYEIAGGTGGGSTIMALCSDGLYYDLYYYIEGNK